MAGRQTPQLDGFDYEDPDTGIGRAIVGAIEIDDRTEEAPRPARRTWLPFAILGGLVLLIGLGALLGTGAYALMAAMEARRASGQTVATALPAEGDQVTSSIRVEEAAAEPAVDAAPADPPAGPPAADATPEPAPPSPEPAPPQPTPVSTAPAPITPSPPAPTAPTTSGIDALCDAGWSRVSDDPAAAARSFRAALQVGPDHPDAHYGLGYALLLQGDSTTAQQHLCRAHQAGGASIQREIRAILAKNDLSCQ